MAEPHAVAGADEGVGVHPCFLGKQGELHDGAVDDDGETAHQGGVVVVTLAEAGHLGDLTQDEEHDGTGDGEESDEHVPGGGNSGKWRVKR